MTNNEDTICELLRKRDIYATLNYSKSLENSSSHGRWIMDTVSCPFGTKKCTFEDHPVRTLVKDLRGQEHLAHLDTTGFQTLNVPTLCSNSKILLPDESYIENVYYPEVIETMKKVTGGDLIVIVDHSIRRSDPNLEELPDRLHRKPVMRVHVDQTPKSALSRISTHMVPPYPQFKRFRIINFWRCLQNSVYDYPVAMADFRSLDLKNDLEPIELKYPDWVRDKETYGVRYNPKHNWYYWSCMTPNEALLIKIYDSQSRLLSQSSRVYTCPDHLNDVAGLCPHTAFLDEKGAKKGVLRRSIEVRALIFNY